MGSTPRPARSARRSWMPRSRCSPSRVTDPGSIRDVALRVGMSEAGLLHHFPNKSALLAAVLDRRDQHSLQRVPFDSGDGDATLRGLVDLAAYNASVPGVVELYTTLSAEATAPSHPAHDYFVRALRIHPRQRPRGVRVARGRGSARRRRDAPAGRGRDHRPDGRPAGAVAARPRCRSTCPTSCADSSRASSTSTSRPRPTRHRPTRHRRPARAHGRDRRPHRA